MQFLDIHFIITHISSHVFLQRFISCHTALYVMVCFKPEHGCSIWKQKTDSQTGTEAIEIARSS
jgi:hypothetical protein